MTKSELIRKKIKEQYGNINSFAKKVDIPYTTILSALNGSIDNMSYKYVLKICEALELDPADLENLTKKTRSHFTSNELSIIEYYRKLNRFGQIRFLEYLEDITSLEKYTQYKE